MAASPAVRLPVCADAAVARASNAVPTVAAPVAAIPAFRKLRRSRVRLMIFPSSRTLLLLHKGLKRITNFGPASQGELLVAPQGPARAGLRAPVHALVI